MNNTIFGLAKATDIEDKVKAMAKAEAHGTMTYYALARLAEEQGLPAEVADTFRFMADQESAHAGFYATLGAMLPGTDIWDFARKAEKAESGAEQSIITDIAQWLRANGHEDAAKQTEEYIVQELHHGELLRQMIEKYAPKQ